MAEAPGGDDGDGIGEDGGAGGEDGTASVQDDDIDKSSLDFEIDRGDYRGIKMSYKAWKRGEENVVNEEETYAAQD